MWIRYGGSLSMTPIPSLFIMQRTIVYRIDIMEMMEHKLRQNGSDTTSLMGRNGGVMY